MNFFTHRDNDLGISAFGMLHNARVTLYNYKATVGAIYRIDRGESD